jgi:hypothetical protein
MNFFAYSSDKDFEIAREYLYHILDKSETTLEDCKECYEEYLRLYEEEPDLTYKQENSLNEGLLMDCAVCSGKLDIIQYFHSIGIPLTDKMLELAAGLDSITIMEWLIANGLRWRRRVCEKAAKYGCVRALKYAREHGCPWTVEHVLEFACRVPANDCIGYILEHGGKWRAGLCSYAASSGWLSNLYIICMHAKPEELEADLEKILSWVEKPSRIFYVDDEQEILLSCIKTKDERKFYFAAVEKYESLKTLPIGMIVKAKQEEIELYKAYSREICRGLITEDVLKHVVWEFF